MSYGFLKRWSAAARSAVVGARPRERRTFRAGDVHAGWEVRDSEGHRMGTVAGMDESSLRVSRGFFRRFLVPRTTIGEVHEGVVILNVPQAWIDARR